MPYDRILVPTDGSSCATRGVGRAVELAEQFGADVHALYVVDRGGRAGDWDMVVERQEREGEAALEAADELGQEAGIDVQKHLRRGHPDEEILEFASETDVDLVVIGTHGRSGFDRIRHAGSTTERVLRGASIPVFAVPPGDAST